jgi:hypothetical protein
LGWRKDCKQHPHQDAQKALKPAQKQTEVVASRGEHGVDAVAIAAFEVVAAHPVLGLEVANDRLDRGTAASRGGSGR